MQALRESAGAPAPSTRRKPAARPAEASPKPKTAQEPKTAKGRRKAG
jgi:hypothetical protein